MRRLLLACILVVIMASAVAVHTIAEAGTSTTVTITATGWTGVCTGPTDLVATKLSDHSVQLTWTAGFGNGTKIQRAFGTCPSGATDGTEVYDGNGTSMVDYVDLSTLDTYICWRAYTICGSGGNISYTSAYSEAKLIGGVTVMYIGIFGLCLGMSWMAFRNRFLLWNIAAAVSWVLLFMYIQSTPWTGVTEGDPVHTVAMLIPIVAVVAVMVHGLQRQVDVQKDYSEGLVINKMSMRMPWQSDNPEEQQPSDRESKEQELEEYKARFGGALRNRRHTGGKRR